MAATALVRAENAEDFHCLHFKLMMAPIGKERRTDLKLEAELSLNLTVGDADLPTISTLRRSR